MINTFLTKLLGASWKTTVWGGAAVISAFITQYPDLVGAVLQPTTAKKIFAVSALITGIKTFVETKDKNVTGGTIQAPEKKDPEVK
jgi:hypothetical protein